MKLWRMVRMNYEEEEIPLLFFILIRDCKSYANSHGLATYTVFLIIPFYQKCLSPIINLKTGLVYISLAMGWVKARFSNQTNQHMTCYIVSTSSGLVLVST